MVLFWCRTMQAQLQALSNQLKRCYFHIHESSSIMRGPNSVVVNGPSLTFHRTGSEFGNRVRFFAAPVQVIQLGGSEPIQDINLEILFTWSGSGVRLKAQDDDLQVKVEPVQWWDVCRRTDWPEKEEFIGGASPTGHSLVESSMTNSDDEGSKRQ